MPAGNTNFLQRIVEVFLRGKLSVLLVIIALAAGGVALYVTPREEEPQIVVPMADVIVQVPGASAREVERQVTTRLEKLLYQVDGVEYVYSMSMPNQAIVTVRFYVGENREDSLIKLYNKISMNIDAAPPTVAGWVVKPVEIDDVPIVAVTLWSYSHSDVTLRRVAEELAIRLQALPNAGTTYVIGGRPRQVAVALDPQRLSGRGVSVQQVEAALRGANVSMPAGRFDQLDQRVLVDAGSVLRNAQDVAGLIVGVNEGMPVYLRDVASVTLGPAEVSNYTQIGFGATSKNDVAEKADARLLPAVTVAVAKKKGSNAVWLSRAIHQELDRLTPTLMPATGDIHYTITRDYGRTANDKVNELVEALAVAIVIVIGLIALTLGWREGLIVAVAVPITFGLTLLVNYAAGYTINRVTLFALILSLGLVVDDPIVDVENIYRHFKWRKQRPLDAVLSAINEVRPPIILATLAVIVSFLPMFFITGMMGPYMRPMALNVPLAMLMSMVVAFTITPWMSYHVLRGEYDKASHEPAYDLKHSAVYRVYAAVTRPFLERRRAAWVLVGVTATLFVLSCLLPGLGLVPLKMLPFDNKNEFQVVVDMPEGTTLERTTAATAELAEYLRGVNGVENVLTFVGTSSPMDFNGMVRHYYLRGQPHDADIRVNIIEKRRRPYQSHDLILELRPPLDAIAQRYGANIKLVEVPPGPPVISTLVAEVYGQDYHSYAQVQDVARRVEQRFRAERAVVDVDSTIQAPQTKYVFETDDEKAALAGISDQQLSTMLAVMLGGQQPTVLHDPNEVNPTPIWLQLPRATRSSVESLLDLYVPTPGSSDTSRERERTAALWPGMIQLRELGQFIQTTDDQTIYHKNLRPVVYVFGETAGRPPANAILAMQRDLKPGAEGSPVPAGFAVNFAGEGEWKITLEVFRDLGLAFAAACLGIYVLLVYETSSYSIPVILMVSIPLTVIGIMPGFWILNLLWNRPIAGYDNPVFFTATAMIGMIALSGIAVRNAILLIDFIHAAVAEGKGLKDAILESGAVRFRPIFLTAGTSMLAAWPITLDPVFSGLAWALIFGLFVSTAFTLLLIPVIYWMIYGRGETSAVPPAQADLPPFTHPLT